MAAPEPQTIREAARLADALSTTRLAEIGTYDSPVAFDFEGEAVRWYGVVHTPAGAGPELVLCRGLEGLRYLRERAEAWPPTGDALRRTVVLRIAHVPLGAIPTPRRDAIRRAGVVTEFAGDVTAVERGSGERLVDRAELRRLLVAVRALVAADDDPAVDPATPRAPDELPTLRVRGDPRDPEVDVAVEPVADPEGIARVHPQVGWASFGVPVGDGRWLVSWLPRDASRAELPAVCVLDRDERRVRAQLEVVRRDPDLAAREFLRGTWLELEDDESFASEVAFGDARIAAVARPALEAAGVRIEVVEPGAALEETARILASEVERLRGAASSADETLRRSDAIEEVVELLDDRLDAEGHPDAAAALAYYGTPRVETPETLSGAFEALCDWIALEHRRTPGGATPAERLLASGDLTDLEREALEARIAAQPALWRVVSFDPESGLAEIADVDGGATERIRPPESMKHPAPGDVLPLRIAVAGGVRDVLVAGPRIPAERLGDALRAMGGGDGRPRPAAFGRLWTWAATELADVLAEDPGEFGDDPDADEFDDDPEDGGATGRSRDTAP